LAALYLGVVMRQDAPFTESDLYSVYVLFRPEAQARERAHDMVAVFATMAADSSERSSKPQKETGRGLTFTTLPSVSFVGEEEILTMEDLLAILSLQSADLAKRVDHFRHAVWLREVDASDDEAWYQRRAEWAEWLRSRSAS
jgi:hypothetical protein